MDLLKEVGILFFMILLVLVVIVVVLFKMMDTVEANKKELKKTRKHLSSLQYKTKRILELKQYNDMLKKRNVLLDCENNNLRNELDDQKELTNHYEDLYHDLVDEIGEHK